VTTSDYAPGVVHPDWCVGQAGGCMGPGHQSAELVVPGDGGLSGVAVKASLWSGNGGREFVALMMMPDLDDAGLALVCNLAEGMGQAYDEYLSMPGDLASSPELHDYAKNPEFVTDPHAHDLTIVQAETLHQALGELLERSRHAGTRRVG